MSFFLINDIRLNLPMGWVPFQLLYLGPFSNVRCTHVPMSVEEAAEYLGIPKGTLYMKLSEGSIPATKPGKRYCLYRDELDKWLESSRKNPVPLSDEELCESISSSHRRKPGQRNW